MNRFITYLIISFILIYCINGATQTKRKPDPVRLPVKAILKGSPHAGVMETDTLYATVAGISYRITPAGTLQWGKNFKDTMHLNTEAYIQTAFLDSSDGKYLSIFYQENWGTEGSSQAEKIDIKKKKSIWTVKIGPFNLGQPYVSGKFVYLTALGTVSKLNLDNGIYLFQFSSLYNREKGSFNYFDTITFSGSNTYFISKNRTPFRNTMTIRLDTVLVDENFRRLTIKD